MRRIILSLVAGAACCLPADFSLAQAPVLSADDLPTESVAQRPRGLRRGSQPTVRRYRSYAVVPGGVTESVTASPTPAETIAPSVPVAPTPRSSYQPPRSSGGSKPSFMRSDSKARGQFGR